MGATPHPQEPQFALLPTTHTCSPTRPLSVVLKPHCHLHSPKLTPCSRSPHRTHARASAFLQEQHPCPYPSPLGDPNDQSPKQGFLIQGPPSAHRVGFTRVLLQVPQAPAGRKRVASLPANGSGRQRAASRPRPLPQPGPLSQQSARSTCSHDALTYASGHEPLHAGSPGVGLGRSSSGGEQLEGKGRGLQATVPGEPGRGPAPQPRAGRAQDARALSIQSRERAEGGERRGVRPP